MVFRDRPVRRAIARIDSCSRKCQRRITLNNAMSNTPAAPAQRAEASVRTWVNSQWQLHPKPGQLSVAINSHAMLRWRIERDYQELKQEIGLGHYEGRGWRGFHHHATLCIAAYGFLTAERAATPPSADPDTPPIQAPDIPRTYRPRGAADPA